MAWTDSTAVPRLLLTTTRVVRQPGQAATSTPIPILGHVLPMRQRLLLRQRLRLRIRTPHRHRPQVLRLQSTKATAWMPRLLQAHLLHTVAILKRQLGGEEMTMGRTTMNHRALRDLTRYQSTRDLRIGLRSKSESFDSSATRLSRRSNSCTQRISTVNSMLPYFQHLYRM